MRIIQDSLSLPASLQLLGQAMALSSGASSLVLFVHCTVNSNGHTASSRDRSQVVQLGTAGANRAKSVRPQKDVLHNKPKTKGILGSQQGKICDILIKNADVGKERTHTQSHVNSPCN